MDKLPAWLVTWLVEQFTKLITPALIKQFETWMICHLKTLAADSTNEVDDLIVAKVAAALGIDPNTCPANPPHP